jgi:hypothetical protein
MPFSHAILNPSNVNPEELVGKGNLLKSKSTNIHSPIADLGNRASLLLRYRKQGRCPILRDIDR